jgi:hypothetical protein
VSRNQRQAAHLSSQQHVAGLGHPSQRQQRQAAAGGGQRGSQRKALASRAVLCQIVGQRLLHTNQSSSTRTLEEKGGSTRGGSRASSSRAAGGHPPSPAARPRTQGEPQAPLQDLPREEGAGRSPLLPSQSCSKWWPWVRVGSWRLSHSSQGLWSQRCVVLTQDPGPTNNCRITEVLYASCVPLQPCSSSRQQHTASGQG